MSVTFAEAPAQEDRFSRERLLHLFTSAPNAFWRHDVDISLSAAVKMARFAQVAGVESTFYVNPRCDFYNLFSREGQDALRAIIRAGHYVGLHCDYQPVERKQIPVEWVVEQDFKILKLALGASVTHRRVSFHMPPDEVLWKDFEGFVNAYSPMWEGRYISDSRGRPITVPVTDDMQVSLHPEHWAL